MNIIDLTKFLSDYLLIHDVKDGSWNGLQFQGKEEIQKVGVAVDAGIETFVKAEKENVDFLIVHHGLYWKSIDPSIAGWNKTRIDILSKNNMSLYAAHLPLDRHPDVGNNTGLLNIIGAEKTGEFMVRDGKNIGWTGKLDTSKSISEIEEILKKEIGSNPKTLAFGKGKIETVAVCSGGGGYDGFYEALNISVDLLITGDAIEIYQTAKDAAMNVIFAGHYATETVGVKLLAKKLEEEFKLETVFLDTPTGL